MFRKKELHACSRAWALGVSRGARMLQLQARHAPEALVVLGVRGLGRERRTVPPPGTRAVHTNTPTRRTEEGLQPPWPRRGPVVDGLSLPKVFHFLTSVLRSVAPCRLRTSDT